MIILFGSSGISLSFYFNGLLNLSYAKARRVSLFHSLGRPQRSRQQSRCGANYRGAEP